MFIKNMRPEENQVLVQLNQALALVREPSPRLIRIRHHIEVALQAYKNQIAPMLGEETSQCKLTWKQVKDIRAKYDKGLCTQSDLSREYKCSTAQIHNIVYRKQRQYA